MTPTYEKLRPSCSQGKICRMIFHSDRTIFFHPGKTAGTAVEAAFGYTNQTHDPDVRNIEIFKGWDPQHDLFLQHATARFMKENMDAATWNGYFRFATVRNPFDRLVSVYYFDLRYYRTPFGTFSDFILGLPRTLANETRSSGRHHLPMVDYCFIDGASVIDERVRFEHFATDMKKIEERVGRPLTLNWINTATSPDRPKLPASEIYTPAMVRVMREVYADDFEAFGYAPDPPSGTARFSD